jgi:Cu(I)/Ag(I) efflux system membrane fusion protein
MNWKRLLIRLGVVGVGVATLIAAVAFWPRGDSQKSAKSDVWTCSMHPQFRLPNPGPCPICGMKLIPVSQLPSAKDGLERRAGLETEAVRHRELFKEVRTVGKLDYSERQVALISSRIAGRVDRVFADFTGLDVKKGDHLVEIYSPDLNVTQNELLIAMEARDKEQESPPAVRGFAASRVESTRTKLRLLGILDEQIAEIENSRKTTTHLTIYAPIGGTIIEKDVRVGQYVSAGDQLYRIADFDPIWLYLNIYEYDVAWVRFGQPVEVTLEAFPGETFSGSVMFIDPFLDDATRTIRVRVNLKNPDLHLKPQMYASATIRVPLRADGSPAPTGLEGKYICPMHPEIVQAEPGECSICEMKLERVPLGGARDEGRGARGGKAAHAGHAGLEQKPDEQSTASPSGVLAIPVSAVLDTGRRRIAYRLTMDGAYELIELKLGARAQATDDSGRRRDYYLVLDGLNDGDMVVVQSGFLLDSQRQIEGMPSLLYPTGQSASVSGHAEHGETKVSPAPAVHKH